MPRQQKLFAQVRFVLSGNGVVGGEAQGMLRLWSEPTPPFPKIEEQIGRVCQSILLKLIQILEGVDTVMLNTTSQGCKAKQEA